LKVKAGKRLPFHLYQFKKNLGKDGGTINHWSNPNDMSWPRGTQATAFLFHKFVL
jgi:hypothetical protein